MKGEPSLRQKNQSSCPNSYTKMTRTTELSQTYCLHKGLQKVEKTKTKTRSEEIISCHFVSFQDRIILYSPAKRKAIPFSGLNCSQGIHSNAGAVSSLWEKLTKSPSQPGTSWVSSCWHGSRGCATQKFNSAPKVCLRSCGQKSCAL